MSGNTDIKVNLVNAKGNVVLKEHTFKLVNGKLPITQICKHFQVENLVWVEIDEKLPADANGLSSMTFAAMKNINLTGTPL